MRKQFGDRQSHKDQVQLFKNNSHTCADDGGLGVAAEAVLQDPGQLTVPVGDVG